MLGFAVAPAQAWHASGGVYCDANQDGVVSAGDLPVGNVTMDMKGLTCEYDDSITTPDGFFYFTLLDQDCQYEEKLQAATVPYAVWTLLEPPSGSDVFWSTANNYEHDTGWLIDSPECHPLAACWLTAGGVKFNPTLSAYLDEYKPKGSPVHSWGGNVNPACAPVKGHWNHIAHKLNLHFQATDIQVITCGNVAGIEPGSESPVTPVNFIEFTGPATLKGINGNKADYGPVCYFARAEDRNEPGSNGAKDGSYVDRYFLWVYNCANPGQTLLLVDTDADPATQDPITITGGNMQMHFKPCDN
jgi:hypothetical protein